MLFVDEIFEMGGGYILNFSDRTMSRFFAEELNVDIDDPTYAENGGSKGRRLRCYLQKVDIPTVVRTLRALWEYREDIRQQVDLTHFCRHISSSSYRTFVTVGNWRRIQPAIHQISVNARFRCKTEVCFRLTRVRRPSELLAPDPTLEPAT